MIFRRQRTNSAPTKPSPREISHPVESDAKSLDCISLGTNGYDASAPLPTQWNDHLDHTDKMFVPKRYVVIRETFEAFNPDELSVKRGDVYFEIGSQQTQS